MSYSNGVVDVLDVVWISCWKTHLDAELVDLEGTTRFKFNGILLGRAIEGFLESDGFERPGISLSLSRRSPQ